MRVFNCCVTCQLAMSDLLFLKRIAMLFSWPFMVWHILEHVLHKGWCRHMSSGVAWHLIWQRGADHVSNANVLR